MLGTIVNTACIVVGSIVGSALRSRLNEKVQNALYTALGLVTLALGARMCVVNLQKSTLPVLFIVSMALGALGVAFSNIVDVPAVVPVVSILIYSASFMFSWGPICWVLISEIFPNTIRSQATAIAVAAQWISNFIVSSTFVPMYNMRLGSMGVNFGHFFSYALYGVICLLAALFVWKMVPETKGKSLEEMNGLWKERMKAGRKTT